MEISRVATAARAVGILAAVLFVGGPAAIQLDLVGPGAGFYLFLLGGLGGGLLALLLGLIGLVRTRVVTGRGGRGRALLGAVLGLATFGTTLMLGASGGRVPTINDITTDPGDPPVFVEIAALPENASRDMDYPPAFRSEQERGYPDLATIEVDTPPAATLDRIVDIAHGLGWTVIARDDARGTLEATQTSRVFRFVDDVVVRVRPAGDGSAVDVRSKSRVGRGDFGVNAARIRRLRDALLAP